MSKILKIGGIVVSVLLVAVGGLVAALALKKPAMRPARTGTFEATPERIARGRYLTEHVADCHGCHSERVTERFGMPLKPGGMGKGGFPFDEKFGVPGLVCAQNITPDPETGLGSWTDGEILRAIREGVDRNGEALFPMMPYGDFRNLADDDATSIVAYLRTLPPIRNAVPRKKIAFPVNLLIKSAPKPVDGPVAAPDAAKDPLGYGRYLVTIGGCLECHTPHDAKQQRIAGQELSGGWTMVGPWGRVVTSNLTPHPDTFMGKATKAEFVGRFKSFVELDGEKAPIAPKGRNTVMPWLAFSGMTEGDLGAIYDYLKSVPPVERKVVAFPDGV